MNFELWFLAFRYTVIIINSIFRIYKLYFSLLVKKNKNVNNKMEAKLMSVKIKLRREGGKKKPFYKVVVIDSRKACNAKFIEQLGYYQPLSEPYVFKIDQEASLKWIGKGAQLSATVKDLFKKEGILKER